MADSFVPAHHSNCSNSNAGVGKGSEMNSLSQGKPVLVFSFVLMESILNYPLFSDLTDVPDPPGRPLIMGFTSRSVNLSWAPSLSSHGSPVSHYIIYTR